MTPDDLGKLARAALKACPAREVEVWVTSTREGYLRFAANTVTTSGAVDRARVTVKAAWGGRFASASSEDPTPEAIARLARHAADLAKLVPPSPERLPPVPPQRYSKTHGWDDSTAGASPASRASRAGDALAVAKEAGLVAAGFLREQAETTVFANGAGATGTARSTSADFSTTMRTPDGRQSGWAGGTSFRSSDIDVVALARRAADKAARWKEPVELPPGRYTAVLEPAAVAPLLGYLVGDLDRRAADEGRSPFSTPSGTKLGERLFSERLTLGSDPSDPKIPGSPFAEDGLAAHPFVAIDRGLLASLATSRYWAKTKRLPVTPVSGNWSLSGSDATGSAEALVAGTDRGVLVTRIWYVRMLAPQTLTVTGITRDATFLIEEGRVTSPVKNFRLNHSVIDLLRDVDGVGPTEPLEGWGVPALRVRELGLAASSDAV